MLEDRTEHPCQVVDMSPGNVAFRTDRIGMPGEKIIAYIDHIGRIEGVVTRTLQDGFAMTVIASDRKKDKLAAQLTWLANKHELDLPEDRRHERVAPRNPTSVLQLTDGRQYQCRIIDLSLSGAAVEIDVKPAIGIQCGRFFVFDAMTGMLSPLLAGLGALRAPRLAPQYANELILK